MIDKNFESMIPGLYATHADFFQTADGWVIAYENPTEMGSGFYGKTCDGEFVWERFIEDLYTKHDVYIFNSREDAEKEF
jgi:hypothetical protein